MAARRARKRKNSVLPLLLAGVLLLGAGGYYFVSTNEDPAVVRRAAPERPAGKVAVPTVRRDMSRGQALSEREIVIKYISPDDVPEDIVINPRVFNERWLVRSLNKGDYIRVDDLATPGAPKGYSGMLSEGKRVAIIPTKGIVGTTGYLQVGDIVDIYSTGVITGRAVKKFSAAIDGAQPGQRPKKSGPSQGVASSAVARLIVAGAEVISTPSVTRTGDKENVVLAVGSGDALKLMLARSSGEVFQFIYRPFGENADNVPEFVKMDRDPRVIDVIKGTKRRNELTKLD